MVPGGSDVPERVPSVSPSRAQAVPEPPQGHLVDHLRRARGDPRGPLVICVPQEVEDDTVPEMGTAHVRVRSPARATLVGCLQGPPPDASEEVWPQASGIQ